MTSALPLLGRLRVGRVSSSCPKAKHCTGPYAEQGFKKHHPVSECLGSWEVFTRTEKHRYKANSLTAYTHQDATTEETGVECPDFLDFKVKHRMSSITIFAEKNLDCREKENSPLAKLVTTTIFRSLAVDKVLYVIWSLYY